MDVAAPQTPVAVGHEADPAMQYFRGSALLLAGRFISLGLNLAVQILIVRCLSKLDFGAFAFALSMVSLASSLSVFGLHKTVARFASIYDERRERAKLLGTLLLVIGSVLGVGLAIVLGVVGLRGLIGETLVSHTLSLTLLLVLITLAPLQALDSVFTAMFAVFASARSIFFRRHILAPGLKLALVIAVMLVEGDAYLLAVGYLAAGLVGVLIYAVLLMRVLRQRGLLKDFNRKSVRFPVREIFGFSLPMFASDIAFLLRGSLVVLFLECFHNSVAVAEFRSVLPVTRLNEVVLHSFSLLFIPTTARMLVQGKRRLISDVYWNAVLWITVFSFPVFAVSFTLAEPLTILLFGQRYADSSLILAVLAVGFYFHAASGLYSQTLKAFGKVRYIVVIDALAAVFALTMNLVLIPRYGALGGALGLSLTLVVHNVANQIGLFLGTGISVFEWRYAKLYAVVGVSTLGLWQVQSAWSPPLYVGLLLAAVASLLVVAMNRNLLDVEKTFPELQRFPLLGRLCGASPAAKEQGPRGREG